ncbi:recombinase family protein [Lysobacter sp. GCM10012299]|uniref:recombinase family protein n=1 Tax=Lysobacter sp. GCM10012299 TaxID=3317333 RepID=UPI00361939B1
MVGYYRVSTRQQGASGLGLEAQQAAVQDYARTNGAQLVATFTEVESGKRDDRPELSKALRLARLTGATLVIAKLDRLSRNAAFLLTLRDSGVSFVCADMPHADSLTIGVLALVAQQEREAISRRTRDALAAAKRRGQTLGNPNGAAALRRAGKGNHAATAAKQRRAAVRAATLTPVIEEIRQRGLTTLRAIADELNARGIQTATGKRWHPTSVARAIGASCA